MSLLYLNKSEHVMKDHDITNVGWLVAQTKFGSRPRSRHTSKEDQLIFGLDVADFQPFQAFKASHVNLGTNNDVKLRHDVLKDVPGEFNARRQKAEVLQ